jgi:hypothetical protein
VTGIQAGFGKDLSNLNLGSAFNLAADQIIDAAFRVPVNAAIWLEGPDAVVASLKDMVDMVMDGPEGGGFRHMSH